MPPTPRVTNVCFHGVGVPQRELEPGEDRYWVRLDAFHAILDLLAERTDVAISFDDSNWSDITYGLPGLLERGLTATFFVLVGRLGAAGSLDEDALRHLVRSGMRIGNHGMTHVSWRRMDTATAHRELVMARERLAEVTGGPVDQAAMPRGQYDHTTLHHLRRLAYRVAYTSDRTSARPGAWLQPRFSIWADDGPATVERNVLATQPLARRLERSAAGLVKRLR